MSSHYFIGLHNPNAAPFGRLIQTLLSNAPRTKHVISHYRSGDEEKFKKGRENAVRDFLMFCCSQKDLIPPGQEICLVIDFNFGYSGEDIASADTIYHVLAKEFPNNPFRMILTGGGGPIPHASKANPLLFDWPHDNESPYIIPMKSRGALLEQYNSDSDSKMKEITRYTIAKEIEKAGGPRALPPSKARRTANTNLSSNTSPNLEPIIEEKPPHPLGVPEILDISSPTNKASMIGSPPPASSPPVGSPRSENQNYSPAVEPNTLNRTISHLNLDNLEDSQTKPASEKPPFPQTAIAEDVKRSVSPSSLFAEKPKGKKKKSDDGSSCNKCIIS